MKIKKILISQPRPQNSSPYSEIISKYGVSVDFLPFFKMEPLTAKEFRAQKVNILDYTAIVFTSRTTIDAFFHLCEELRVVVPESMKYFCVSEAIALYLQKYIVYRKRKIFFGNGSQSSIIDAIGTKHKDEKFLIATADCNKNDIQKLFVKTKFQYNSAVFVKTINSNLADLKLNDYQMVVFYSPSDIKSLLDNFPTFEQKDLQIATFGPATAKAVKSAGFSSSITAPTPEAPSIAKALTIYLDKK